jgi:chromosome segregation ATPase
MKNEKEEIQRKLETARVNLLRAQMEMERLAGLITPLTQQLTSAQSAVVYLQGRVEKLTKILAEM